MKWSTSPHRPPHLFLDEVWYFVTASTVNKSHILCTEEHLNIWVDALLELVEAFRIDLTAWVVLPNHYHILFLPQNGEEVGKFIKRLNGRTSYELNGLDQTRGRSVWYSYWDTCIRGEHDFWTRFNYIHYNPVKHGYVQNPESWAYSSYPHYVKDDSSECLNGKLQDFLGCDLFDDDKF